MYCPNCGRASNPGARFCENCGAALSSGQQAPPMDRSYAPAPPPPYQTGAPYQAPPPNYGQPMYGPVPMKNAGLAALIALIIPGAGHIYDGKVEEGILFLIISVVLWVIGILTLVGLILVPIFYIWQIFDAYSKANQYNMAVQQTGQAPW